MKSSFRTRYFPLASILVAGGLLVGCAGSTTESAPPAAPAPTPEAAAPVVEETMSVLAQPVKILGKISGDRLKTDGYTLAVLNNTTFTVLGLGELFAEQGVDVNLDEHSVILFALGEQTTGGFAADISAVQIKGKDLFVQGSAVAPAEDAVVTQAITHPYCAVAVKKLPRGLTINSDITSLR